MPSATPNWIPPSSREEKIRGLLLRESWQLRYKAWREWWRGEAEIRLLPFLAGNGRAIDMGANIGVWSYWLARAGCQVEAFEPNPKIFARLAAGASKRINCHAIALSNQDGEAELRVPKRRRGYSNQGASLSTISAGSNYGSLSVVTRKLDSYGFSDISFIKIDVEGFELHALQGAKETLSRCRPVMIIEMEEKHHQQPIEKLLAAVEEYGYEAFALRHGQLCRAAAIDFDAHHRQPASRKDYIFNFIFLPRSS